jgi:hypothetical protein
LPTGFPTAIRHGVTLSDTYLHPLAHQVGQIAMAKHAAWHLEAAAVPAPVATLADGVDGMTMPVVGEACKEARCGSTLAWYEQAGQRLPTEYLGTMPEAGGKELITARFCCSRMRWKRESGALILQLRAIKLSQHWDSFWSKVRRYAA